MIKPLFAILSLCTLIACISVPQNRIHVSDEGVLAIRKDGQDILHYNYKTTYPPAGLDTFYKRSGYIHPVFSPSGNVLTEIQPADHIHHYGVWNPWTRLEIDGNVYDLWNLQSHQGTVRAGEVLNIFEEDNSAGFTVQQSHIIFTESGERKVMNEELTIRAWDVENGFLWDFESLLRPVDTITIKEYRYGGLVYRATAEWTRETCEIISSDKSLRAEIDGTTARWIYVNGLSGNVASGLLIMCHPANHNAPQPLRIWDENANNNRGDVMINFYPAKFQDWLLEPGSEYRLKYRFFSYDGRLTPEKAEQLWSEYVRE